MYSDDDPRSWNYARKYERPSLNLLGTVGHIFTCVATCILLFILAYYLLNLSVAISVALSALLLLCIVLFQLSSIIVWCVKCYQRFAPTSVRSMCRFEPSCSEYMIQAIKKYGAIKGSIKGINRIYRCANKDGGFDYP